MHIEDKRSSDMCTVMVIESRLVIQNWLKECIQNSCIKVDEILLCDSAVEAMDYIRRKNIDIAITRLQKEDCTCVKLIEAMHKKLMFSIVLGYGTCKDYKFLCNVINCGVSKYLGNVLDKKRVIEVLNEAYESDCSNKMKLNYLAKIVGEKTEVAYSNEMLTQWVDSYSRNAIRNNPNNIEEYLEFIIKIMDSQNLYHSKSMILELIIMINEKISKGNLKSDSIILNSKECCTLMKVDTIIELKIMFLNHMRKLAKNIYILTSANNQQSLTIIAATGFIKNNYHKDISRDSVANAVNLNPSYFSKFFKEQMNESFISYLRRLRIETAILYLENSTDSIKEISKKVGYLDSNYFSRLFYKHTGYTPCEYRKRIVKLVAN